MMIRYSYLIEVSTLLFYQIGKRCTVQTTDGRWCHFPFTYRGKVYHKCTSDRHHRPWCSTTKVYDGRWGNCKGTKINVIVVFIDLKDVAYYYAGKIDLSKSRLKSKKEIGGNHAFYRSLSSIEF